MRRLAILYVLDGAVYASPSLHAVLASRLVRQPRAEAVTRSLSRQSRCAFDLRSAFALLQRRLAAGLAAEGVVREPPPPPPVVSKEAREEERKLGGYAARALASYDASAEGKEAAASVAAAAAAAQNSAVSAMEVS